MRKGQVVIELRTPDAFGPLFGRVFFVRGRQYEALYAWRAIDDTVRRQLAMRGVNETFTFKAAKATWIYEPVSLDPVNADPTLAQFYDVVAQESR